MSDEQKKKPRPIREFLLFWVMLALVQYLVIFLPESAAITFEAVWKTVASGAVSAMVISLLLALEREKRSRV